MDNIINNENEEVKLFDPTNMVTYSIVLNKEDAEKCRTDVTFAQAILQHAKSAETESSRLEDKENTELEHMALGSGTWSLKETEALISAYEAFQHEFDHAKKRKHVWQNIANQLNSLGVERSAEKCEVKWRNLIRTYKSIKDNKQSTGRAAILFQHFAKIDEILGTKPSISCEHSFSSDIDDTTNCSTSSKRTDQGSVTANEETSEPETAGQEQHQITKKRKKNISYDLKILKLNYLKNKEKEKTRKDERKAQRLQLQKRMLELN